LGPTASGKTEVAIRLAERFDGEVISVDSMQVYRGMDIGTAKPGLLERRGIPHHMIDIADPEEEFSVAQFRRLGREVLAVSQAQVVIITGGSGLHFRALVDPMSFAPTDPELRARLEGSAESDLVDVLFGVDPGAGEFVDLANHRRVVRAIEIYELTGETPSMRAGTALAEDVRRYVPEIGFEAVGIDSGAELESRIEARLSRMRAAGLIDEVRRLAPHLGRTARNAVGYRQILSALRGDVSLEEAFARATSITKRIARKQRTWFQRDPRIRWIPWIEDLDERSSRVLEAFT
jgi:tRNA dimethylallyltransferase